MKDETEITSSFLEDLDKLLDEGDPMDKAQFIELHHIQTPEKAERPVSADEPTDDDLDDVFGTAFAKET